MADPVSLGLGLTKVLLPVGEKATKAIYHVVREHATVYGGMTVCRRRIAAAEDFVTPWVGTDHLDVESYEAYRAARVEVISLLQSIERQGSWLKRFQLCRECRHKCREVKTYAYTTSANSQQKGEDAAIAKHDAEKAQALAPGELQMAPPPRDDVQLPESPSRGSDQPPVDAPSPTLTSSTLMAGTISIEAQMSVRVTISVQPSTQRPPVTDGVNTPFTPSGITLVPHTGVSETPEEDRAESVYEDAVSVLHA